jgi:hypothetical protein
MLTRGQRRAEDRPTLREGGWELSKSMFLSTTRMPKNGTTIWSAEFVRAFRVNRWLVYLVLVPAIAATTLSAIFFFAVLAGLIAAMAAAIALRVWWLRWKVRHARSVENLKDRHVVITEARIVGREADNARKRFENHARS